MLVTGFVPANTMVEYKVNGMLDLVSYEYGSLMRQWVQILCTSLRLRSELCCAAAVLSFFLLRLKLSPAGGRRGRRGRAGSRP